MAVRHAVDVFFKRGGEDRFTGQVWLWQPKLAAPDGSRVAIVHFTPGSRTFWHRHPGGQFQYAVSSRGRVHTRGGRGDLLDPGDVVYTGSKSWHFHGTGPDTPMVHVAVTGGGSSKWDKAVSDEEYAEGFWAQCDLVATRRHRMNLDRPCGGQELRFTPAASSGLAASQIRVNRLA